MIDDENLDRSFPGVEFQAEFLNTFEECTARGVGCAIPRKSGGGGGSSPGKAEARGFSPSSEYRPSGCQEPSDNCR